MLHYLCMLSSWGPKGPITSVTLGMFEFEAVQCLFGATAQHGIRESTQSPQCPLPHCTPMSMAPHSDQATELGEHQG